MPACPAGCPLCAVQPHRSGDREHPQLLIELHTQGHGRHSITVGSLGRNPTTIRSPGSRMLSISPLQACWARSRMTRWIMGRSSGARSRASRNGNHLRCGGPALHGDLQRDRHSHHRGVGEGERAWRRERHFDDHRARRRVDVVAGPGEDPRRAPQLGDAGAPGTLAHQRDRD